METIWLVNFPLPPSVNEYLMPVAAGWRTSKTGKRYQKARFVKTEPHTIYLEKCRAWRLLHNTAWTELRAELQGKVRAARAAKEKIAFRVDTFFAFEDSRLWTSGNLPQQLDADNRLKPCRDALAHLLEIDDKYFFSGFFEKVSAPSKPEECTFIRISACTPRTIQDLRMEIKRERDLKAPQSPYAGGRVGP
jgi:Holliday junction resolvase RusA-like endonuclease